ncbi:hypothetical protein D3C73_1415570 [compost metagenome]
MYRVPELPAANLLPKMSAQIAGKIEKISPQNRKIKAAKNMNAYILWPHVIKPSNARPSPIKTMNMVFSRPILSEMKPHNGRVIPLATLSIDRVMVNKGKVTPNRVTGSEARP